jgi:hypothetical protein
MFGVIEADRGAVTKFVSAARKMLGRNDTPMSHRSCRS